MKDKITAKQSPQMKIMYVIQCGLPVSIRKYTWQTS